MGLSDTLSNKNAPFFIKWSGYGRKPEGTPANSSLSKEIYDMTAEEISDLTNKDVSSGRDLIAGLFSSVSFLNPNNYVRRAHRLPDPLITANKPENKAQINRMEHPGPYTEDVKRNPLDESIRESIKNMGPQIQFQTENRSEYEKAQKGDNEPLRYANAATMSCYGRQYVIYNDRLLSL